MTPDLPDDDVTVEEPVVPYEPTHRVPAPAHAHLSRVVKLTWLSFTCLVISLLGGTVAIIAYFNASHTADQYRAKANAGVGAAQTANASLSAAGLPTVEIPTSAAAPTATVTVTGPSGDTGQQGPGPSDSQVAAAVVSYCSSHSCSTPPSSSDVASAVAAYCVSHAGCLGAAGPPGPQGEAGQNATTDQIAAAVQAYCAANNGCQGPVGGPGAPGPVGPTGPLIPSFTFTIHGVLGDTTYTCSAPDYQCVAS